MWPWKRQPSNLEVVERLESLERRFKTLTADVDEYFQMVRRAENRIKSKERKLQLEEPTSEEAAVEAAPVLTVASFPNTTLSDRQKQIQQQILRRRAGVA